MFRSAVKHAQRFCAILPTGLRFPISPAGRAFLFGLLLAGACYGDDTAFISMAGDCRYPAVASEDGTIYLVWLVSEGRNTSLYFRRSDDEGRMWTGSRRLSNDRSDCFPPSVAVSAGTVHVVWVDYGETIDGEIYYARSRDRGETWEKNRIVVDNSNSSRYPQVTCNNANVYLIWQDVENKVYFKASYDQGTTWGENVFLSRVGKHSCYCYPPAISANGRELTVVWTDFRDDRKGLNLRLYGIPLFKSRKQTISSVACRVSYDNGLTWGKEDILSACAVPPEMNDELDNPVMLFDGAQSYLFWLDRRNVALGEIFLARFRPGTGKRPVEGTSVCPIEKRSPKRPSVVFDEDKDMHLVWATFFGGKSIIHYGEINAAGNPLRDPKELTTSVGRYHNPVLVRTRSGRMHVFWFNEPEDKEQWSTIFLKTSADDGLTWTHWSPPSKDM